MRKSKSRKRLFFGRYHNTVEFLSSNLKLRPSVIVSLSKELCRSSCVNAIVKTTTKMGTSRTNSTSAQIPTKKEEGGNHLVECTGPGVDGSGCVIWTDVWVPTLVPKNFFSRPFLCGFGAVQELKKIQCSVRIFGVEEEPSEDTFAKVVSVDEKTDVSKI